ncbi:MAG TPA: malate synthase A, partial [Longimicrobiales bacterium]
MASVQQSKHVHVSGPTVEGYERVLTAEALDFVGELHRRFNPRRLELLQARAERARRIDAGEFPTFLPGTAGIRADSSWRVAPAPRDLVDRRVEITGPAERKMIINALNSGASVFMADFEDALSPTWANVVTGQANLQDAVRRRIELVTPEKTYRLKDTVATLLVRPRGWHLHEKHVQVGGESISASLFDFGLYFFHNAAELLRRGSGPYFYLPKLESHLEARLWNDVFKHAQDALGIARGSIRCTVLVETILGAFEMEEILYELREHGCALNAGRWDYIFSIIKKFKSHKAMVLPDRAQVTMAVPFMRAYSQLLVKTCHSRGAHAIGGMAAFIPNRRDPEVTERALAKVTEDKEREAGDGFDGTWVAHPDLVPTALAVFDRVFGERSNQLEVMRNDVAVEAPQLLDLAIPGGAITWAGVRLNVSVALQYMANWLAGTGAVAIYNLMEDAATAEISRAQLWQWLHNAATLDDGRTMNEALYQSAKDDALGEIRGLPVEPARLEQATSLLDRLVLSREFTPFLTL